MEVNRAVAVPDDGLRVDVRGQQPEQGAAERLDGGADHQHRRARDQVPVRATPLRPTVGGVVRLDGRLHHRTLPGVR